MQFLRVGIIASKLCYQRARVLVSSQEGISRTYRIKPYEQSQESAGFIKVKKKDTPKIINVGRPGKG